MKSWKVRNNTMNTTLHTSKNFSHPFRLFLYWTHVSFNRELVAVMMYCAGEKSRSVLHMVCSMTLMVSVNRIEPEGGCDNEIQNYPVVIQDLPCELSGMFGSLAKKEDLYTLDDLVRRIFEPAVAAVSHGVKLWIAVQDKAQLVTVAKHRYNYNRCKHLNTSSIDLFNILLQLTLHYFTKGAAEPAGVLAVP